MLAQKFVDETKADSEAQAAKLLAEAESKARTMTEQAQAQAGRIAAESEQRLREEIHRLEDSRNRLAHEVDSMSRHLESERNRLRTALGDILRWVDQNVHPATPNDAVAPEGRDGGEAAPAATAAPATMLQGGNRPATGPTQVGPAPQGTGTGPSGEVTQMRPTGSSTPLPL